MYRYVCCRTHGLATLRSVYKWGLLYCITQLYPHVKITQQQQQHSSQSRKFGSFWASYYTRYQKPETFLFWPNNDKSHKSMVSCNYYSYPGSNLKLTPPIKDGLAVLKDAFILKNNQNSELVIL